MAYNYSNYSARGFSFFEIIASLSLVSLMMISASSAASGYVEHSALPDLRMKANHAAHQVLDSIRRKPIAILPLEGSEEAYCTIDNTDFAVRLTYCVKSQYCVPDSSRHLFFEVYYKNKRMFTLDTVHSQPAIHAYPASRTL